MVKILAALSILNSSGATEKVAALVARATCSGASHSSASRALLSVVPSRVLLSVLPDSTAQPTLSCLKLKYIYTDWPHRQGGCLAC